VVRVDAEGGAPARQEPQTRAPPLRALAVLAVLAVLGVLGVLGVPQTPRQQAEQLVLAALLVERVRAAAAAAAVEVAVAVGMLRRRQCVCGPSCVSATRLIFWFPAFSTSVIK
jgi:hypothetical protein